MERTRRISELDGLRGAAVIMVLAWHFIGSMVDRSAGQLEDFLHAATIFGRTGVDLFFVLSGFLIIGIIVDNRRAPNFFRVFYTRRAWRIYPPYAALIVAYWACYGLAGESPGFNTDYGAGLQLFAQVTFLWNWLMAFTNGPVARAFSVTWSVAIEEWFYLTFPLMLWVLPKRWIVPALIAVGAGSALLRAGAAVMFPPGLAPYVLPMFRLDGLCIGGLLAMAYRAPTVWEALRLRRRAIGTSGALFAASLPLIIALSRDDILRQMYLWGHAYLSLGYAVVLAAVLLNLGSVWLSPLRWRPAIWAGTISYTLYLFHPLFISLYFELAGRPELVTSLNDAFIAGMALLTAAAFSVCFYWLVERPALGRGAQARYAAG